MEPAKIDWKNLDSKFVEDALYEHINAPKWVDFLAPHNHPDVDDDAWFCRPDCRHPKTAGDFLKLTPNSKATRSSDVFQTTPLGERTQRDANLKRRGLTQPSGSSKIDPNGDCENQNPNPATSPYHVAKSMKAFIKSSSEKKKPTESCPPVEEAPGLKSTLSARNLFAGKDIFNQITEFCSELKKLATRAREKESVETLDVNISPATPNIETAKEVPRKVLGELSGREKERTPLFEVSVDKSEGMKKGSVEKKLRRRRLDDGENIPMSLDLGNLKRKGDGLTPIRTYPPSPQCFSATRPPTRATPPKASRSKPMEKGIVEGADGSRITKEECVNEARSLDMFWFLKPCTQSST